MTGREQISCFAQRAGRLGLPPARCVVVGEDVR